MDECKACGAAILDEMDAAAHAECRSRWRAGVES